MMDAERGSLEWRKELALRQERSVGLAPLGALAGPVAVLAAWWLTGERQLVGMVAQYAFIAGAAILVCCHLRAMQLTNRLKHVRRQVWRPTPGGSGPVRGDYETQYDYDRFTALDFDALRAARFCVRVEFAALLASGAAVLTWAALTHFVWG